MVGGAATFAPLLAADEVDICFAISQPTQPVRKSATTIHPSFEIIVG